MKKILILFCCIAGAVFNVNGQGCSDAGFCTMGAMKPDQNFSRKVNFKLRSAEISYYRGETDKTPVIHSVTADLNFGLTEKFGVQVKIPYMMIRQGTLGTNEGVGDISVALTRNIKRTSDFDLSFTIGAKIPTNNSSAKNEAGLTLPGYYQSSLGTYDLVAGVSLLSKKWLLAFGYQQALTSNENDFTWGEWVRFPDREYLNGYDVGIGLRRGIDLMLRVERNWRFVNYSFNVGILPIYRITPDRGIIMTRENGNNITVTGLALSTLVGFTYHVDVANSVKIIYGYKLTDRPTNPDGLTRDNVVTVAYQLRF